MSCRYPEYTPQPLYQRAAKLNSLVQACCAPDQPWESRSPYSGKNNPELAAGSLTDDVDVPVGFIDRKGDGEGEVVGRCDPCPKVMRYVRRLRNHFPCRCSERGYRSRGDIRSIYINIYTLLVFLIGFCFFFLDSGGGRELIMLSCDCRRVVIGWNEKDSYRGCFTRLEAVCWA